MKHITLSIILLLTCAAQLSAQNNDDAKVFYTTVDTNANGTVTCDELAAYLRTALVQQLRAIGVEPRTADTLDPCGTRTTPPSTQTAVNPQGSFAEYLRDLVQRALNKGAVNPPEGVTLQTPITLAELTALSATPLAAPLTGTISTNPPKKPRQSWDDVIEHWVDIRQSYFDDAGIGKPAKIALTNHAHNDETVEQGDPYRFWAFHVAVSLDSPWEKNIANRIFIKPVLVYELSIESSKPKNDLIVHRVGASTVVLRSKNSGLSSHLIDATFDYSTDRHYDAEVLGATVQYSPNYPAIGIGQYLGRGRQVDFQWRPYIGAVWGNTKNPGSVEAYQKIPDFSNQFYKFSGELKIGSVIKVGPEVTLWHGDRERSDGSLDHWASLALIEARWILAESEGAERASLAFSGKQGRDSPGFAVTRQFTATIAFKF